MKTFISNDDKSILMIIKSKIEMMQREKCINWVAINKNKGRNCGIFATAKLIQALSGDLDL
ncbi:MAG: hypothetical protein ABIQ74_11820 [Chitinophagales bacterium]